MVDVWQSDWFEGTDGKICRIVLEQKGANLHEFLEYEDKRRDRFLWEGSLIHGFNFTRLGNRVVQIPQKVLDDMGTFINSLEKGTIIIKNGTKAWRK